MGLIVSMMRKMALNQTRMDLEYKLLLINSSKLELSASVTNLENLGSDLDPNSAEAKSLKKRQERLHLVEKRLDEQAQRYQMQLKMIEAEIQTLDGQIDSNIQMAYGR